MDNIFCMDCMEGMKAIKNDSIDLTVTSPPYDNLRKYKGFKWDFEGVANELFRITKPGGVVVWIVADGCIDGGESGTSFRQALYFQEIGFRIYDTMIWEKPSPQAPTEGRYYDVFEYMFVFSKGKPKTLNLLSDRKNKTVGHKARKETRSCRENRKLKDGFRETKEYSRRFNVWNIARGNNKTKHPAVFPLQLAKDHILSWSNPGDVVLDPFSGSGTTAVAAIETQRHYIGFEISKEYFDIAQERINEAKAQLSIFDFIK